MRPEILTPAIRKLLEEAARIVVATVQRLSFTERIMLDAAHYNPAVIYQVLLEEIDRLRRDIALIERAPTEPLVPTIGGPCEAHYRKGRNDLAKLLRLAIASEFMRARLDGDDHHATERRVLAVIRQHEGPA